MLEDKVIEVLFVIIVLYTILLFGMIGFFAPYIQRSRNLAFQNQMTKVKAEYDRHLLTSKIEIREETIKAVSQELHDNISQKIYLSQLYLETCGNISHPCQDHIAEVEKYLSDMAGDVQALLKNLRLDLIATGNLCKAMRALLGQLERSGLYEIELIEQGEEDLSDEREIFLFRIFQEAINNILKHAEARHIQVELDCGPGRTLLSIRDDGKGFDLAVQGARRGPGLSGMGLQNMVERALLIGADLVIESQPGAGTCIRILLNSPIIIYG